MTILTLEKTTGFLVPKGVAVTLGKGASQQVILQFLQSGVAEVFEDGTPIALEFFTPDDLVTPKGSITSWTKNASEKTYTGTINTSSPAMAWIAVPVLLGLITYGSSPDESDLFHVRYGLLQSPSGSVASSIERITVLEGNNIIVVPMLFMGQLTDEQLYGYFVAPADGNIIEITHEAQDIPTGGDVSIDLTKAGVEQSKLSTLAADSAVQRTAFATPLACSEGDIIRCKVKQPGATNPGGWLKSNITYQITPAS